MTYRPESVRRPNAALRVQQMESLRRSGLSTLGVQQALQGSIVSDPADREAIARILAAFASLPPHVKTELYDYPGEYAQRFDGVDKPPVRHE